MKRTCEWLPPIKCWFNCGMSRGSPLSFSHKGFQPIKYGMSYVQARITHLFMRCGPLRRRACGMVRKRSRPSHLTKQCKRSMTHLPHSSKFGTSFHAKNTKISRNAIRQLTKSLITKVRVTRFLDHGMWWGLVGGDHGHTFSPQ